MELTHSNRIFFDPTSHSYLLDDNVLLMGVTGLMKKHGLGADYSGIPQAVLNKAAEAGTELHREIQDYENGLSVLSSELIDEYKKLNLRFIESEYPVSDFETVASAIDCVYEGKNPDGVILVDIKGTQKLHRRPLEWQLGIYKVFFERMNPGVVVEGCYCLHIDKKTRRINGFVQIEPVTETEVDALLQCERDGLVYIDENAVPGADLVLSEDEITTYISKAAEVERLKSALKELEGALAEYDSRILSYMEKNNIKEMEADGGVFKKKESYQRTTIDTAKLKKAYPSIYEQYSKTTTVKSSLSFIPDKD